MPKVSNSNYFDPDIFGRGEYLLETELRYSLLSHPGKLRLIGWVNSAYSGSYAETLANPALDLDMSRNSSRSGSNMAPSLISSSHFPMSLVSSPV